MKGTTWNGDYFASKGCTRSDYIYMFSVGGLVAFESIDFSSPDGRSYSHGCIPKTSDYKLQEEILLEEYDRTEGNRYGSGSYDAKEVVELEDQFWHEYSRPVVYKTFLLGILDSNENVFTGVFINGEITEVRNHQGRFLHIYEIPEEYRRCKKDSFAETVIAINLQKKQEDEHQAELVVKNWRGVELVFGITVSGWYASRASFGYHSVQKQHEYDGTFRNHHKIVVMPCVPNGDKQGNGCCRGLNFYIEEGTPIVLWLYSDREPRIDILTETSWCNSQSWHYSEIQTLEIEPGWIFVDGEDVFYTTKKIIKKNRAKKILARNAKFDQSKAKALEAGITETQIGQVIKLAGKGKVMIMINLAARMVAEQNHRIEFALQIFSDLRGKNQAFIENYAYLVAHAKEIKLSSVKKVAEKAGAWSYLQSLIPGYGTGYFDDAMEALKLALVNKVPFKHGNNETFGGENGESDLAIKLREAGLTN